jgi:hypothetical protein
VAATRLTVPDQPAQVCWHETRPRPTHPCVGRDGEFLIWGRYRSGHRWFWAAGQPATASLSHRHARERLRTVNAEQRRAGAASDTADAGPVEFLYGVWQDEDCRRHVEAFQVTRKTAKRVYYIRRRHPGGDVVIGYVSRQALDADGGVYNRAAGWGAADYHLTVARPDLTPDRPTPPDAAADLRRLRREMGDAHPDRGGTAEQFMAARRRYKMAVDRLGRRREGAA